MDACVYMTTDCVCACFYIAWDGSTLVVPTGLCATAVITATAYGMTATAGIIDLFVPTTITSA